jgi:hypothetical protein
LKLKVIGLAPGANFVILNKLGETHNIKSEKVIVTLVSKKKSHFVQNIGGNRKK